MIQYSRCFGRSHRPLLAAAALAWLIAPGPASAAPMNCPLDQGFSVCTIIDGNTALEVRASSLGGGQLLVTEFQLDGVNQIGLGSVEGFAIYDLIGGGIADSTLDFATADPVTRTIQAQFTGINGAFQVDAAFTLTGAETSATLDEAFTVTSFVDGLMGRVYAVTDFDIDASTLDDSISSTNDGAVMTQVDGDYSATVEVVSGPLPDGFEVAVCCNLLDIVFANTPLVLSGATSAPGPDDFLAALSWDRALDTGQNFQVSLRKTVVPEPAHALFAAAGTLLSLALARRIRR